MPNAKALLKKVEERGEAIKKAKERLSKIKLDEEELLSEVEEKEENKEQKQEEVKQEEKQEEKKQVVVTKSPLKNDLSVSCELFEAKIDERNRTVVAGVLQEDTLSANNRFYPAKIVRKAIKSLPGKKSIIGHDSNSVEDVVAKIVASRMRNGLGLAEFKFGTDEKSDMIFQKIKDGLIESTSIRASGTTRRAKVNDEEVDVVESLDIGSVDWVVEGGVSAAKVVQVFEASPKINYDLTKEERRRMELEEQLKGQLKEKDEEIQKLMGEKATLEEEIGKLKNDILQKELDAHKVAKVNELVKDEGLRGKIIARASGASIEELDKSIEELIDLIKAVPQAKQEEIIVRPSDEDAKEEKYESVNDLLHSKSIKKEDKLKVLSKLLG